MAADVHHWLPLDDAPAAQATVTFNADGHWTGSDGCNTLGGKFKASATKISTYDFGPQTAIGCNNLPNTTVLERAARWQATSTTLTLYNKSSTPGHLHPLNPADAPICVPTDGNPARGGPSPERYPCHSPEPP